MNGLNIQKRGISDIYRCWINMRYRCGSNKHPQSNSYFNKGITVCGTWLASFETFLNDMGPRPKGTCRKDEYSLDRIDNSLGYFKENCRWATRQQQAENRSNSKLYAHNGESHTLYYWARMYGMTACTLTYRLRKGYTLAEALKIPVLGRGGRRRKHVSM